MKSRNALITALALGLGLAAPAFAQDAMQDQSTAPTTTDPAATQAPPQAQPADLTAQTSPTQASPAQTSPTDPAAAAGAQPKQVTWSDLDVDKDGKLNKTEVASVPALTQVFDDADADKDGALTPDEYKAFVAQNQSDAAAQPQNEG